jgi:hypothetical protein
MDLSISLFRVKTNADIAQEIRDLGDDFEAYVSFRIGDDMGALLQLVYFDSVCDDIPVPIICSAGTPSLWRSGV